MENLELKRERIEQAMQKKLTKIKENGMLRSEQVKKQANAKLALLDEAVKKENAKQKLRELSRTIPVFYAADANYLPYLSVSLQSLKDNASKDFCYKIYILNTDIDNNAKAPFLAFNSNNFTVEFVNLESKLSDIKNGLQLRDYYTGATYYRIFIANMFPQYDKALYLDSDTVVLGDISKLYSYDLKDFLVGAVTDKVVSGNPVFQKYCREVLGIEPQNYFNAGILVMNLKRFRTDGFYETFRDLLSEYKFCVAQDQDYLNVICKNKVKYLPYCWNTMPIGGESKTRPQLIHYNLTLKPWHYVNIPYAKYFWKYAQLSSFADDIRKEFGAYNAAKQQADSNTEKHLLDLAQAEIEREDNFIKIRKKMEAEKLAASEGKLFLTSDDYLDFEDNTEPNRVGAN